MKMTKDENNRLDRIEEKIDKLSDAIVTLARAEEKIHNLQDQFSAALTKLNDIDDRIRLVETKTGENEKKLSALSKFFWVIVTATATAVTGSIAFLTGER
jgi:predicted  nucleic acid-binding Zn-ribbon protein